MLASDSFSMENADPLRAWEGFKQFVREPVECADDTVSVHVGRVRQADAEQAVLRLSRRFEINDEEKFYDHLEIVSLVFRADTHHVLGAQAVAVSTTSF